jgi:hypothetical protein
MAFSWTAEARQAFLEHLALTGNITGAARAAGLSRSGAYALRAKDGDFAAAWTEAAAEAVDALEREARRRAVEGVEEPLIQGGKLLRHEDGTPMTIRHYSDRLLELLLKAHRPDLYTPQTPGKSEGQADAGRLLTDQERARRVAELLERGRERGAGPAADQPAVESAAGTAE